MLLEESFGTIVLKKTEEGWLTFLVKLKSGNHWGFPKGHANLSETPTQAAYRELKEETNLKVLKKLYEKPLVEEYFILRNSEKILKKVTYFIVEAEGKVILQKNEILDGKWVKLDLAKNVITHETAKMIAKQVEQIVLSF
ncbi:MAG: NUDIX domain-containing protein [Parachlamydiales bacterium]|nr:NUDIX domain-containing protein [Parachlamydiales bacterium]